MLKWIMTILSFSLLLGGTNLTKVSPCRVVTEISVEWQENGMPLRQVYTDQGKMNKYLIYLRSLGPQSVADIPDEPDEPLYEIRLTLSDGSTVLYKQQGTRFFQETDSHWQAIDPEDASRFPLILAAIPSDF